jgi:Flp pilus assembly protein TadG
MRGTFFGRLRTATSNLLGDRRGNAMMLTAAAIVPVIGIVGSAIDIGRAYMTQLRLQQACDAGVLAGRRAMAGGTYDDTDKAEANKMFGFNFPTGIYGSRNVAFASLADKSDVNGTASAILPTAMMYIFGKTQFSLSAACTAKLEISNVDVMMVLDVTKSMDSVNSGDTQSRMTGLRAAAKSFFATLTNAHIGDGQLRFGIVPYSSAVNVGQILHNGDKSWLASTVRVPSRSYRQVNVCTKSGCSNQWRYVYEDRDLAVGDAKPGDDLTFNTGTNGDNVTAKWGGCVVERATKPFSSTETAPSDAYDMDIDLVPTSDVKTKWQAMLQSFAFERGQVASLTTTSSNLGQTLYTACPNPAMKMTIMGKTNQATFDKYLDDLIPIGGTYHDVGMAWGARLISPTGLFAAENRKAATNDRPISRHILFMTDGEMDARPTIYSHQGMERSQPRVGASDDAEARARHDNRFRQLCAAARSRNITIWVVSFGVGENASLNNCASSGAAFKSNNSAQLNANFQAIARQISKLRLSQ